MARKSSREFAKIIGRLRASRVRPSFLLENVGFRKGSRRVAIAVYRLTEQCDFARPARHELLDFVENVGAGPIALSPTCRRHDAERTAFVAAFHNRDIRRWQSARQIRSYRQKARLGFVESGDGPGKPPQVQFLEQARKLSYVVGSDDEIDIGRRPQ